ncbi:MAG: hypothetical protein DRJ47_06445 [Thermoprotei archaeon]|nr:MAG: hypothetical protein DRJ47_06445 [Thermoprotei archaeon]
MSYIPREKIEKMLGEWTDVVSKPQISGPSTMKYGRTVTLTASGSKVAFKEEGVTLAKYVWELPDGTVEEGDTIDFPIPNDPSLVGKVYTFKCYAVDSLGNKSRAATHQVEVTLGGAPDINSITWSEEPPHHDNTSYEMTINATDPENEPLTYTVVCDDANVTIEQDAVDPSKFTITYPDYTSDTDVTFTITVSDGTYDTQEQQVVHVFDNLPPTIDQITWDVNPPHYYSESYTMTIDASDPEGDSLTYNVTCDDANVTIQQDATYPNQFHITYPAYTTNTTVTYTVEVSDGKETVSETLSVDVLSNKPPVITGWTWSASEPHIGGHSYDLSIDASDPEGDPLTYSVTCDDAAVAIDQDDSDPTLFHVTYPDYNAAKTVTFTIHVSDGENETTQTDQIDVNPNNEPVIDGYSWSEDPPHRDNSSYDLTITAHDDDGDPLTYSVTCSDGSVNIVQDGVSPNVFHITYPDYSADTTVTFIINVSDGIDTASQSFDVLVENTLPVGDIGLFGGGSTDTGTTNSIEYVVISSTPTVTATSFGNLTSARYWITATSNGTSDRGVFGGGVGSGGSPTNTMDFVTISTPSNASTFGSLSTARYALAATSNGTNDRGVFGGGYDGSVRLSSIEYVTISSTPPVTASSFGDLTVARLELAATSNGTNNRGVFGGGADSGGPTSTIDYISISTPGSAYEFGDLNKSRRSLAATSNGTNDRGLFGGGLTGEGATSSIEYITISTPSGGADFGSLTTETRRLAATSNGTSDRGLFGGGVDHLTAIDYVTISSTPPVTASNFGNLDKGREMHAATSNA